MMVHFRPQAREIIVKIVYYGPPLGGKTTNLRTLYQGYPATTRGELVVVPAGGDRTIFFDFLPMDAGQLRGHRLRVQLYTVPGQVHYNATRQVVLRGIDGIVFVADCQRELMRSNKESWENLKENLLLQGLALHDVPHVLQYNKRDLPDIADIDEIDSLVNEYSAPFYEAVASQGIGVEETLQGVVKLVARSLRERFKVGAEAGLPGLMELTLATSTKGPEPTPPPAPFEPGARVFSFTPPAPQASSPAAPSSPLPTPPPPVTPAPSFGDVFVMDAPPPEPKPREDETTQKVKIIPVPVFVPPPMPPLDDPFVEPSAAVFGTGALAAPPSGDVFEFAAPEPEPEPIPEPLPEELAAPAGEVEIGPDYAFQAAGEVAAPEEELPEITLAPEREVSVPPTVVELPKEGVAAIQRVVPRALAQYGEVRELELEVPVPAMWVGGKRMTLQLRLTLVPQEDDHGG